MDKQHMARRYADNEPTSNLWSTFITYDDDVSPAQSARPTKKTVNSNTNTNVRTHTPTRTDANTNVRTPTPTRIDAKSGNGNSVNTQLPSSTAAPNNPVGDSDEVWKKVNKKKTKKDKSEKIEEPLSSPPEVVSDVDSVKENIGAKFVYFIHKKGARAEYIPTKIGAANDVAGERKRLEEGSSTDLKTELIIVCANMDGEKVLNELRTRFVGDVIHRGWYKLSKERMTELETEFEARGYKIGSEGRARLTLDDMKKLNKK